MTGPLADPFSGFDARGALVLGGALAVRAALEVGGATEWDGDFDVGFAVGEGDDAEVGNERELDAPVGRAADFDAVDEPGRVLGLDVPTPALGPAMIPFD